MNLKRICTVVLAVALVASLTACGGEDKGKAVGKADKNVTSDVVSSEVEASSSEVEVSEPSDSSEEEVVDPNMPTTSVDGVDASTDPNLKIAELINVVRDEASISNHPLVTSIEDAGFEAQARLLGLKAEDVSEFAFAVDTENGYAVAIIKPAEGKETFVKEELTVTATGLSSDIIKYEVVEESGYVILANNTPEYGEMAELAEQIKSMVAFEAENKTGEVSDSEETANSEGEAESSVANDVSDAASQIVDEATKIVEGATSSSNDEVIAESKAN